MLTSRDGSCRLEADLGPQSIHDVAGRRLQIVGENYRTKLPSLFQRTDHGQRQTCHGLSPSATEKNTTWARPMRFSSGT
jgi:hypothetical protein